MSQVEVYVGLEEFEQQAKLLVAQIEKGKYDIIACVAGGGMHLSYYLSKALKIPHITNIVFQSYDTQTHIKKKSEFVSGPGPLDISDKNVLLVDDLIDGGGTLNDIVDIYMPDHQPDKAFDVAVLYTKVDNKFNKPAKTTIYAAKHDVPRQWIQFYYEKPFEQDK